jgi:hypothetical protein
MSISFLPCTSGSRSTVYPIAADVGAHQLLVAAHGADGTPERPDLDDVYMAATVAMSGSGGWPMTAFLAPDQRPFFAETNSLRRQIRSARPFDLARDLRHREWLIGRPCGVP